MKDLAKMEFAAFVKLPIITKNKENGENSIGKLRINPMHITSYYEAFDITRDLKPFTVIMVGGTLYSIEMLIEEVDEMMDNIDRSMSIKE